jgi:uncharacterized protein (DUF2384 family)
MSELNNISVSDESLVLGKAILNAGERLGLDDTALAALLATDVSRVSAIRAGQEVLKPQTEEWLHALMLVQVYQGLLRAVGSDHEARQWLSSDNFALGARPFDLLILQDGLECVLKYLKDMRVNS